DAERVLQPRFAVGHGGDRAAARAGPSSGPPRGLAARRPRRALRPGAGLAQPGSRVHAGAGRGVLERDGGAVGGRLPVGLEPALAPGVPARGARRRRVRAAAAAHPSGDLGVRRRDDGGDDAVHARGRARAPPRAAGRRPNRPGVRVLGTPPITVLVSACGAPGTAALMRALRENGEREVRIVGTDMGELAIGRHLADAFHHVPAGSDPAFADAMLEVCRSEGVDAVLPQSSFDLLGLAEAKDRFDGIAVLVSTPEAIHRSNDKAQTYALLDRIGVRGPAWRRVSGGEAVAAAAHELGYPEVDVCMKPVFSSGSRGFRVLSGSADRHEQLLSNRPGVAEALRLEDLLELLGDDSTELLVMELATGKERTIDGIAVEGRIALGHPKTREAM